MKGLRAHAGSLLAGNARLLTRYVVASTFRMALAMAGIFIIRELLGGILGDESGRPRTWPRALASPRRCGYAHSSWS